MSNPDEAKRLKEKGNAFYKSGKLLEAIEKYKAAVETDPNAPLLYFNLSAAEFEVGRYQDCLDTTIKGISLCSFSEPDSKLAGKLRLRQAKCDLHLGDFATGGLSVKKALTSPMDEAVKKDAKRVEKAAERLEFYHELIMKEEAKEIVMNYPRYRPRLCTDVSEYYNLGHDDAESQFDSETFPKGNSHSFLFGGIGDARHLYATFIEISSHESKYPSPTVANKYHFTILDIKIHVLARDLLIFLLLEQLAELSDTTPTEEEAIKEKVDKETDILAVIFYVYVGVVMPSRVHEQLLALIDSAENALTNNTLPSWIHIREEDVPEYKIVYQSWKGSANNMISTAKAAERVVHHRAEVLNNDPGHDGIPGCKRERASYEKFGALIPPPGLLKHEPRLETLMNKADKASLKKIRTYIGKEWKINTTIIDEEWSSHGSWDVSFDPFTIAEGFYNKTKLPIPKNPAQLFDYLAPFFRDTANTLRLCKDRIKVECYTGELNEIMEVIRHEMDPERPDTFPLKYDRIHMSNIPDYTGGHLGTLIYAVPILKSAPHAYITSTCLLNPPLWQSVEDYLNEYMLIPSLPLLKSLARMILVPGQERVLAEIMPLCAYTHWRECYSTPIPFTDLAPKEVLQKWLYGVFFKIAIPVARDLHSMVRVNQPLNLTIFFRLLIRLVEIGYPKHWVSMVLEDILENRVSTSAQIPNKAPLPINHTKTSHPVKHVSTAPFVPEMETLASAYTVLLPFAILTPLPRPEKVMEYTFEIPQPLFRDQFVNVLALVFYPDILLEKLAADISGTMPGIRQVLSYTGPELPIKTKMRERMVVISTFWWEKETKTARFWLKDGVIEKMGRREEEWVVCLFRTDDWTAASVPVLVRGNKILKRVVRWIDVEND